MELKFLDTGEAAEFLGRRRQTFYNWRSMKKGPPYYMVGGRPLYLMDDLISYAKANRVDPEAGRRLEREAR